VSQPPFSRLNLSTAVGDDPAAVSANRERVLARVMAAARQSAAAGAATARPGELRASRPAVTGPPRGPGRLAWLRQVHGARVAYLPMSEVDRAVVAGETRGFVKLIAGPRRVLGNAGGGRILGATIVASRGGELVHEPALAMRTGMFAGRLAQAVHAYPTWSIALRQTAAQFFMEIDGRTARPAWPQTPGR
jgi:hypothetical protein